LQQDGTISGDGIEVGRVVRTAGITGVSTLVGQGAGYVVLLLLTLLLGAGGFGLFSLAVAVQGVAVTVASLGLDITVLRFAAWHQGREDTHGLENLLRCVILFVAVWSAVVGLGLWAIAPLLSQRVFHKPDLTPALRVVAWGIPLNALFKVFVSGLHGCGLTEQRVYTEHVFLPLARLIVFAVALLTSPGVELCLWAYVVAYALAAGRAVLRLVRVNRFWQTRSFDLKDLGAWVRYAVPAFLDALLVTSLGGWWETALLGMLSTKEVVGIYNLVLRLRHLVNMPMTAFNTSLAPLIARLHAKGDRVRLNGLFVAATRWVMMLGLPLGSIIIVFGQPLLSLFGQPFTEGYAALACVTIVQLVSMCVGPVGHMLLMTGHSRVRLVNSLVVMAVQVGLGLFMVPRWGLVGAGFVAGLSIATVSILGASEVFVLLRMHPYRLDHLKPLLACLLSAVAIAGIRSFLAPVLWLQALLAVGFLLLYASLMFGFGLNSEDRVFLVQTAYRLAGRRVDLHEASR